MNRFTRTLVVSAFAAVPSAAQDNSVLARGDFLVTPSLALPTFGGWFTWRMSSPPERLAGAGSNLATGRLVYLVYPDLDENDDVTIQFRKSIDGGRTWPDAQLIHTLPSAMGAALHSEYETVLDVFATGNSVYVVWLSNEHATSGTDQSAWVMGSADQGQTWSAPLQISTGSGALYSDVNLLECAASNGFLYLTWLGDHVSGKPVAGSPSTPWTGNGAEFDGDYVEDLFFASVLVTGTPPVVNVVVAEQALTRYNGRFNCDWPSIAALGGTVHVVWNDDSDPGLPSNVQDKVTKSITSFDGGASFSPVTTHTPIYGGSWDRRWFKGMAAITESGGTTYVHTFSEDGRNGTDAVYMDRGI